MSWLLAFLDASWTMTFQAAPYIIFGLAIAGLMHVLLPESLVLRWMGAPGLWGVIRAAVIGVPLPVCSCGVVPITVELRRKGASRPSAQSFLITTPESSIDSIFLTWGMMGPLMAIARPIAAFFTAVLGGILSIVSARSLADLTDSRDLPEEGHHDHGHHHHHDHDHHHHGDHGHDHDHGHHHHHHHHHGHDHSHSVAFAGSDRARLALRQALFGRVIEKKTPAEGEADPAEEDSATVDPVAKAVQEDDGEDTSLWQDLLKPAGRYGFGELLDDLSFWLVVGIGLAGLLTAVLPDDLGALGLGEGILPMIGLLIVGIPLYMCASASTPIAAALMLKGISPGAALVFLLAGPATNAATVLQLGATFGRRFVQIYVASVALGALGSGLLLDFLLGDIDLVAELDLAMAPEAGPITITFSLLLLGLLARSLWRGAWASGVAELRDAMARVAPHLPAVGRFRRRHWAVVGMLVLGVFALTGLRTVPTGSQGYGFVFGALVRSGVEPGLHYLPPAPIGRWEIRLVDYPRKTDVGFRTDLDLIQRRRELTALAPKDSWHSPVAAMNSIPAQASYLTGDGNLVEVSFSVHYTLREAETFFYGIDHGRDFVNLYAEAVARELIAGLSLENLMTEGRAGVETLLRDRLQADLEARGLGIQVISTRIVDLHPPGGAVHAFRDVSSAKEDRETAIHIAREDQARRIPRSRGYSARTVADAEAEAARRSQEALGKSRSFIARAAPFGEHRSLLRHLLWIESLERTLPGRQKLILPPDRGPATTRGVTLWRGPTTPPPLFPEEDH
ncbi:MAG: SO_0444 family Cu/Zn efflux transporter [Acidobacteriota bacterium]